MRSLFSSELKNYKGFRNVRKSEETSSVNCQLMISVCPITFTYIPKILCKHNSISTALGIGCAEHANENQHAQSVYGV